MKIQTFGSDTPIKGRVYIGIDPSLTGYAVCALDATQSFEARVFTPATRGPERLSMLRTALLDFCSNWEIADIAIEGTVVRSSSSSVLGEISGVTKEALLSSFGIAPLQVPPQSLKKYVIGKGGSGSKALIMMKVLQKWGVEFVDDNAADAYGLARISAGIAETVAEAEVVLKLSDEKYRV